MTIAQGRLTLDDFLTLPERKPPFEYEDGVVSRKVSPKGKHTTLQYRLPERFNRFAEPRKLAFAFPELRVSFAGLSRVPDIAIYRWERIPRDADGEVADAFREAPDVAIEIVSPGQSIGRLIRRCRTYVERGAKLALLIDPQDRSVIVFRPDGSTGVLRADDPLPLDEVAPGFELSVREMFESLKLG